MADLAEEPTYLTEPTDEALERICNASWGRPDLRKTVDGVTFLAIYQHNACNHTLSGTIYIDGVEHGFIIENGDWNGTEVRAWGDPEDVGTAAEPEPPEPLTLLPRDRSLFSDRPGMWGVYLAWRREAWFSELVRSYAYDRHFQPGGFVEGHYRTKAEKRGLRFGYLSELGADERASIEASASNRKDGASPKNQEPTP